MLSSAGCELYNAKDPYWMFGLFNFRITAFVITLVTGLIIALIGKFIWKFVHFSTGFGLLMSIFLLVLYPAFEHKGYRINWELGICFPMVLLFSGAFGFFLTHFPKGGCYWLGGWLAYLISANMIYDLIFNWVPTTTILWYWLITLSSVTVTVGLLVLTRKKTNHDLTYHLWW